MPATSISPFAPAHVRCLLLPIGIIKRSSFQKFIERLQPEWIIRLGDISPDPRPDRATFSPVGFPGGSILLDLSTSIPPNSHLNLASFETFRSPLLIICIADGKEYQAPADATDRADNPSARPSTSSSTAHGFEWKDIQEDLLTIADYYRHAVLTQLIVFDYDSSQSGSSPPPGSLIIPTPSESKSTTVKTVMCDVASKFLSELCLVATRVQALEHIDSPRNESSHTQDYAARSSGEIFRMETSPSTTSPPRDKTINGVMKRSHEPKNSEDRIALQVAQAAQSVSRPSSAAGGAYMQSSADWPQHRSAERPTRSDSNASTSTRPGSSSGTNGKDRRSKILGKTSNNLAERGRSRVKARQALLIGTFYLQAGRWPDALRELVDATTRARAFADYVWFAKGLENILVTMLMLAYAGIDFQIPNICYPVTEKSYSRHSVVSNPNGALEFRTSNDTSHTRTLELLSSLLPDLIHMTSNAYLRAISSDVGPLPQLCFSQAIIRLANLLATLRRNKNMLNDVLLSNLVYDTPIFKFTDHFPSAVLETASKREISSFIFRAFPSKDNDMTTTDMIIVLSDMAAVLSSAGLPRKQSIVCRELLSALVPALIQARKMGAAEVGIHPAAGLAVIQGFDLDPFSLGVTHVERVDIRQGFRSLLLQFCRTFGIDTNSFHPLQDSNNGSDFFQSEDEGLLQIHTTKAQIMRNSSGSAFGGLGLKSETLRLCANFSEALPDFSSVSKFNSMMLRVVGPKAALANETIPGAVRLSRDEQLRLISKVNRNLNFGQRKNDPASEPEFWDDFLLRDITLSKLGPSTASITQYHIEQKEATTSISQNNGPFLHKAFQSQEVNITSSGTIAANEPIDFLVTLQNPYDFELNIEKLSLVSEGLKLSQIPRSFHVFPSRMQKLLVPATPVSAGALRIFGCKIKIQGCREKIFLPFALPWKAVAEHKIKRGGLRASNVPMSRPNSVVSNASADLKVTDVASGPANSVITFTVTHPQPLLEILSTSLSQSMLDLVEGEEREFQINVRNASETVAADFFHLSFRPITSNILADGETEYADAVVWMYPSEESDQQSLAPGEIKPFHVRVMGKLGMTGILVVLDYAKLEIPIKEMSEATFHARQLTMPLAITVSSSVQLQRIDVAPLPEPGISFSNAVSTSKYAASSNTDGGKFLLMLDVRNFWSKPLFVSLTEVSTTSSTQQNYSADSPPTLVSMNASENIIQPGQISRIALSLPRVLINDPGRPIPFDEKRQFVLRKADQENDTLETRAAYWFRKALLERIRGTWRETQSERTGTLDFSGMQLTPRMVDTIRRDELHVSLSIDIDSDEAVGTSETGASFNVRQPLFDEYRSSFRARCHEFIIVRTTIRNDSERFLRPFLRVYPRLKDYNPAMDMDMRQQILWTGLLQRSIAPIAPGEVIEVDTELTVMAAGVYEVGAVVDEIKVTSKSSGVQDFASKRFSMHFRAGSDAVSAMSSAYGRPLSEGGGGYGSGSNTGGGKVRPLGRTSCVLLVE